MQVLTVHYHRTFALPNYENIKVGLEASVAPNETTEEVLDQLADMAKKWFVYKTTGQRPRSEAPKGTVPATPPPVVVPPGAEPLLFPRSDLPPADPR